MQIWHVKMWIISIITWKSNCKKHSQPEKHVELQFGCTPTLVLSPTMKIWLGNSSEMCLQGLNLSSTRNSAFHHDLASRSRPWMLLESAPHKSENMNTQEWLIWPPFVVGGLVIIHSIYDNWRIGVIKPFQCLYRSKRFLSWNRHLTRHHCALTKDMHCTSDISWHMT